MVIIYYVVFTLRSFGMPSLILILIVTKIERNYQNSREVKRGKPPLPRGERLDMRRNQKENGANAATAAAAAAAVTTTTATATKVLVILVLLLALITAVQWRP